MAHAPDEARTRPQPVNVGVESTRRRRTFPLWWLLEFVLSSLIVPRWVLHEKNARVRLRFLALVCLTPIALSYAVNQAMLADVFLLSDRLTDTGKHSLLLELITYPLTQTIDLEEYAEAGYPVSPAMFLRLCELDAFLIYLFWLWWPVAFVLARFTPLVRIPARQIARAALLSAIPLAPLVLLFNIGAWVNLNHPPPTPFRLSFGGGDPRPAYAVALYPYYRLSLALLTFSWAWAALWWLGALIALSNWWRGILAWILAAPTVLALSVGLMAAGYFLGRAIGM